MTPIERCEMERASCAAYIAEHGPDYGAGMGEIDWMVEANIVKGGLPKPYYEHGGIVIFNSDCRDILPHLPKVDLVLTDPPYGHGELWQGGTWGADPMYADARRWDVRPPDYVIDLVLQAGQKCILWGGNYFEMPPSRCWLSWWKSSRMPTLADFELAWTNFDRPSKAYLEDRNPDGKRYHPTQKPLSLIAWCLGFYDGCVCDPYMGSGTTLVAAKQLGRRAIGIEIEEKYCEIAVKRLSQEMLPFVAEREPEAEQMSLDVPDA
jgi:site-specific DNA-methyltransferase (adenine-specific)